MRLIEIKALKNGAHRNQSGFFTVIPEGWAVIPQGRETESFPFSGTCYNERQKQERTI